MLSGCSGQHHIAPRLDRSTPHPCPLPSASRTRTVPSHPHAAPVHTRTLPSYTPLPPATLSPCNLHAAPPHHPCTVARPLRVENMDLFVVLVERRRPIYHTTKPRRQPETGSITLAAVTTVVKEQNLTSPQDIHPTSTISTAPGSTSTSHLQRHQQRHNPLHHVSTQFLTIEPWLQTPQAPVRRRSCYAPIFPSRAVVPYQVFSTNIPPSDFHHRCQRPLLRRHIARDKLLSAVP